MGVREPSSVRLPCQDASPWQSGTGSCATPLNDPKSAQALPHTLSPGVACKAGVPERCSEPKGRVPESDSSRQAAHRST